LGAAGILGACALIAYLVDARNGAEETAAQVRVANVATEALAQVQSAASAAEARATAAQASAQALQNERNAQERKREQERAPLLSSPSNYLEVSGIEQRSSGLFSTNATLTAVTILNRSKYAVRDIHGDTTWIGSQGTRLGTTPFAFDGLAGPTGSRH
jgi:hypothetical protein